MDSGPHQGQPLITTGAEVSDAKAATILIHGRGASARSISQLGQEFSVSNIAYLAPQAANNTWYPNSFLAPVESNEPGRTSGLSVINDIIAMLETKGIERDRILLLGFSQGACLASEYVARNPDRYGGLAVLSGGLIGETIEQSTYSGDLESTPVFIGCSDVDPHIPVERVHETAAVFEQLAADVTVSIYEGMGHTINDDERNTVKAMIESLI